MAVPSSWSKGTVNPTGWEKGSINPTAWERGEVNSSRWIKADSDPSAGLLLLAGGGELLLEKRGSLALQ